MLQCRALIQVQGSMVSGEGPYILVETWCSACESAFCTLLVSRCRPSRTLPELWSSTYRLSANPSMLLAPERPVQRTQTQQPDKRAFATELCCLNSTRAPCPHSRIYCNILAEMPGVARALKRTSHQAMRNQPAAAARRYDARAPLAVSAWASITVQYTCWWHGRPYPSSGMTHYCTVPYIVIWRSEFPPAPTIARGLPELAVFACSAAARYLRTPLPRP